MIYVLFFKETVAYSYEIRAVLVRDLSSHVWTLTLQVKAESWTGGPKACILP